MRPGVRIAALRAEVRREIAGRARIGAGHRPGGPATLRRMRPTLVRALVPLLLVAACSGGAGQTSDPTASKPPTAARRPRAILISVDGLMPEVYTNPDAHRLKVPTLRRLVAEGAWASEVRSVMPAVTYAAHTTLATGVWPDRHGIVGNLIFDPLEVDDFAWFWYDEDIKVPTLWSAATDAGRRVAVIGWPASVGARATFVIPEFWRKRTAEDLKLLRAVSTPGLFAAVEARIPTLWDGYHPPKKEQKNLDIAIDLLRHEDLDLLMLHTLKVDASHHQGGPWSDVAIAAIEQVDAEIDQVIEAARQLEGWEDTAVFIVSDHGFTTSREELWPTALLSEAGLIELDPTGKPIDWRVSSQTHGGTAYLYLRDPADRAGAEQARQIFRTMATGPGAPIARIIEADEIRRMGGDPRAFLAMEAAEGFVFAAGHHQPWRKVSGSIGQHGYFPDRADMMASFIAVGPAIRPRELGAIELIDVAPTVASWLGVPLRDAVGKDLNLRTATAPRP